MSDTVPQPGDRFESRRRTRKGASMVVTVESVESGEHYADGVARANVRRNTSRRRQRIRVDRLLSRDYWRVG